MITALLLAAQTFTWDGTGQPLRYFQIVDAPGVQVDPQTNVPIEQGAAMDPSLPAVEPIAGMNLEVSVGGVGAFTADTEGALKAFARIRTVTPLPFFTGKKAKWNARLLIRADFTGLPGRTVNLVDVSTFNAIEFYLGVAQPVFQNRYQRLSLYFEGGFATSLPSGNTQPLNRTQRWFGGGAMMDQKQGKAWLKLGIGGDQRLDSTYYYAFALMVSGSVRLWTETAEDSSIHKFGVSLGGDASLGLGWGYLGVQPTRDLVRVWVGISR